MGELNCGAGDFNVSPRGFHGTKETDARTIVILIYFYPDHGGCSWHLHMLIPLDIKSPLNCQSGTTETLQFHPHHLKRVHFVHLTRLLKQCFVFKGFKECGTEWGVINYIQYPLFLLPHIICIDFCYLSAKWRWIKSLKWKSTDVNTGSWRRGLMPSHFDCVGKFSCEELIQCLG